MNIFDAHGEEDPDQKQRLPDFIQAHGGHVLGIALCHAAAPAEQQHERAKEHKGRELYGRDEYVPGVRAHCEHSVNGFSQFHSITSSPL